MMSSFYGALRKEREVHVTDLFSDETKSLAGPLAAAESGILLCRVFDSLIFDEIAKTANWRLFLCQI